MERRVTGIIAPIDLADILLQTVQDHILQGRGRGGTSMSNRGGVSCSAEAQLMLTMTSANPWVPGSPAARRAVAGSPRRFYSRSAAGPLGGRAFWVGTPHCCFYPKSLSYRMGRTVNFLERPEGCMFVSHHCHPPEPRRHLACPNCCVCSPEI